MSTQGNAAIAAATVYTKGADGYTTGVPAGYTLVQNFNDMDPNQVGGAKLDMQFAIYKSNSSNEIIIAFRGTENMQDASQWADLGWNQWERNRVAATEKIQAALTASPGAKIIITGHGLGGMIAQYAAYDMQNTIASSSSIELYTVGSPGVGQNLIYQVTQRDGTYIADKASQIDVIKHFFEISDPVAKVGDVHFGGAGTTYEVFSSGYKPFIQGHDATEYASNIDGGAALIRLAEVSALNLDPGTRVMVASFLEQLKAYDLSFNSTLLNYYAVELGVSSETLRAVLNNTYSIGMGLTGMLGTVATSPSDAGKLLNEFVTNNTLWLGQEVTNLGAELYGVMEKVIDALAEAYLQFEAAAISIEEAIANAVTAYWQAIVDVSAQLAEAFVETSALFADMLENMLSVSVRVMHEIGDDISDFTRELYASMTAVFPNFGDPLVLDMNNDGISLTGMTSSHAYFNLQDRSFATLNGWVTGGDGLLAQDSNSNGIIDNIDELFGSATQSGFGELATLDSNADGKITSADAAWSTLKLWVDADGDGVTDAGELNTLGYHNITEIGLAAKTVNQNVNGNILVETSTFVMNGETRTLGEVLFEIDPTNSIYAGNIGEISWDALSLPFLRGYGVVADSAIAMSLDAALLAAGENLAAHAALGDFEAFRAEMRAFMFKWAGVEGVDKDSRNAKLFAADAQELAFLEKYTGINFETPWNENDPGSTAQWAHVAGMGISGHSIQVHTVVCS